jgi:hypothetical protein
LVHEMNSGFNDSARPLSANRDRAFELFTVQKIRTLATHRLDIGPGLSERPMGDLVYLRISTDQWGRVYG